MVTINPDGSPQVAVVWVGLDGDEIVSGHLRLQQKIRNVQRDSRVVLSMETGVRNPMGLDEYLIVRGSARVTEGGAPELLQRLARVYLGPAGFSDNGLPVGAELVARRGNDELLLDLAERLQEADDWTTRRPGQASWDQGPTPPTDSGVIRRT